MLARSGQFLIQSAFLPRRKASRCVRGKPNIGHQTLPKMWEVRYLYAAYIPGERLWIDPNGKMETRHPVEGQFNSEFPAICNHYGDWSYGGLKSQDVKNFRGIFWVYFAVKFSKFCFESLHGDTNRRYCVQISWKFGRRREISEIVHRLRSPDQKKNKISAASDCRYCSDRAQNLSRLVPSNVLTSDLT